MLFAGSVVQNLFKALQVVGVKRLQGIVPDDVDTDQKELYSKTRVEEREVEERQILTP